MSAEQGEVYILRPDDERDADDEGWVNPQPASEVILDAVADAVDEDPDDYDDLHEYVDRDDLAAVLDGDQDDEEITFQVEDHEVTVDETGDVAVATDDE